MRKADETKRRGKLLGVTGFLVFAITFLLNMIAVASYTDAQLHSSVSYAILAFLFLIVSPSLIAGGILMYLYGVTKSSVAVSRTSESAESKIVEKPESRGGWTTYQKTSVAISITSIVIAIILRVVGK